MIYGWPEADALLLTALGLGTAGPSDAGAESPRVSLLDLLGTIDYINRTVLNADELEGALRRLGAAGLVAAERGEVLLTQRGRDALGETKAETALDQVQSLQARLAKREEPEARRLEGLTPDAAARAVSAYLHQE